MLRTILVAGLAVLSSSHGWGQTAFEVASIKPSPPQAPGHTDSRMSTNNGRLNYTNVTLKDVIGQAYKVPESQISGPDFIDTERFDIAAKIPADAARGQVPVMLQTLLSDRFHLAIHRDSKEQPVYALAIAKGGPKLKTIESESGITSNSNRTHWHLSAKINMRNSRGVPVGESGPAGAGPDGAEWIFRFYARLGAGRCAGHERGGRRAIDLHGLAGTTWVETRSHEGSGRDNRRRPRRSGANGQLRPP